MSERREAQRPRIGVIGAGVAGLSAARRLADAGLEVTVFEKSRGLGGRMACRRRDGLQFDHGAQFVDADAPALQDLLAAARSQGLAADWTEAAREAQRYVVGVPGMNAMCRPLADGLDIRFDTEIRTLRRAGSGWAIGSAGGDVHVDRVILTIPAPQLPRLEMELDPETRDALYGVRFAPALALMVAFEERPDWPAIQRTPPAPFALILRDSSKPGRPGDAECWVAHADEAWSRRNVELDRPEIGAALLSELEAAMAPLPPSRAVMGHRWRYSQATQPLGRAFIASGCGTLLFGGDWALGDRVEHAAESGRAMAAAILAETE
ncbi:MULTISPECIES: NAD(P)/FAD-dependent oxidoreductase [unclassified Roseivivax]|uniref:NAD(P)/FAD-dependent oxidoreductase n=1 Tax=unclassified Roseivivax TaxID=2639302 RepID=UPI0015625B5D|nr:MULTISPECIES: FAD-dependent oxidoreductase [unclassified Roseivivax]